MFDSPRSKVNYYRGGKWNEDRDFSGETNQRRATFDKSKGTTVVVDEPREKPESVSTSSC